MLRRYLRRLVKESPFYREFPPQLGELPVMDKAAFREHFGELNPYGINLEVAEASGLAAERERDFSSMLPRGVTVGLSSGTSGGRGVFLVSGEDRCRWAGIVLARALSKESLKRLLFFWRPHLKIAFFLRANSNLYRTVASRRIEFRYFDLLENFELLVEGLQDYQPDLLIAPATVLAELAMRERLAISPVQVISVAEVLDERDAGRIERKFQVRPGQLYQATEGFIGYTCEEGRLHLNEEYLHVECEWLDESRTRFHPVITDFSRRTQAFVRYRLDDILVAGNDGCPCGRVSRVIERIEGRADEVLWLPEPVFPDAVRQALYAMPVATDLYRIEQHGGLLKIFLRNSSPELERHVAAALHDLFNLLDLVQPVLRFSPWSGQAPGEKQRRIRCFHPLSSRS